MPKQITIPEQNFIIPPSKLNQLIDAAVGGTQPDLQGVAAIMHGWADVELSAKKAHEQQVETQATYENHRAVEEGQ